jgi:hypothetical protein
MPPLVRKHGVLKQSDLDRAFVEAPPSVEELLAGPPVSAAAETDTCDGATLGPVVPKKPLPVHIYIPHQMVEGQLRELVDHVRVYEPRSKTITVILQVDHESSEGRWSTLHFDESKPGFPPPVEGWFVLCSKKIHGQFNVNPKQTLAYAEVALADVEAALKGFQ